MKSQLKRVLTPILKPRSESGDTGTYRFAHGTMRVNRVALCNHLIVSFGLSSFIEIGTRRKVDMNDRILAQRVASVDPDPRAEAEYIMTSDEYFCDHDERFDMIFIDGDHTGRQVKKDITNALKVLNSGGFILLHDMNPPTAFHARETYEVNGKFPSWNGTSWEGYAWHRKNSPNLAMSVVDTDWGVGVVQLGRQSVWIGETEGYEVLEAHRTQILNLISVSEFLRIFPAHSKSEGH